MIVPSAPLPRGTWTVDRSFSSIEFQIRAMGTTLVKGIFREFDGRLVIDAERSLEATGEVTVASMDTRDAARDDALCSIDFFDAARFPQISFESAHLAPAGVGALLVTGDLTIKGITRSTSFVVVPTGVVADPWAGAERASFEATATIFRRDFGLDFAELLDSGAPILDEQVKIVAVVSALREEASG